MTKREIVHKINAIPDDILEAAYCFDIILSDYIQMEFNSKLLLKYRDEISNVHIEDNGFLKFTLNGQIIHMT